jgi:O-methyltransferase
MFVFVKFIKDILILTRISYIFYPVAKLFNYIYYWNLMISATSRYKGDLLKNDFYRPFRNYNHRELSYEFVMNEFKLDSKNIMYLEFGVAGGNSFNKFVSLNNNSSSKFYGFDTFEGLPEDWGGFFKKGDMSHDVPNLDDSRAKYIKGLFQNSLVPFIDMHRNDIMNADVRVIHMDADLYSATIFTLSQLYPFLKAGDIIFFDEYNVPMHEFKAFKEFTENFYVKYKPLTAVNNYYQMSFMIE